VLLREPGFERVFDRLTGPEPVRIGAPSRVETGIALAARIGLVGKSLLARPLDESDVEVVDLRREHWTVAVDAFVRYGKGRHPTALNFGDCLTYARRPGSG